MALVSISEAIELSGVSRATFYRNFLNKGLLSTTKDSADKKKIDTSELLRVFPDITLDNDTVSGKQNGRIEEDLTEKKTPASISELDSLRQQLQESKARELKLEKREAWYQQQVAEEKARAIQERLRAEKAEIKLLEHLSPSKQTSPVPSPDKQLQKEIEGLKASLRQLSARRWWQVWK